MGGQIRLPGQDEEDEPRLTSIEDWGSLNTKANRPAIQPNEFSWIENWMPIGHGNMRTLYDQGAAIYTTAGGKTIITHYHYNLGAVSYTAVFLSDGSAVQVNSNTGATVTIGPAGTFYTAGGDIPSCTQYESIYLLIGSTVSVNGYWVWDGTSLFGAGTLSPEVTVINGGTNYTTAPTVTASGGSGTGATFAATVAEGSVATVSVATPGSGWKLGEVVTLSFSGGGSDTQARAHGVVSATGGVGQVSVTNGGSAYSSDVHITFSGGGGTGAQAVVSTALNGVIVAITVTNPGSGYTSAPTVAFVATAGTGATAIARVVRGQITSIVVDAGGSGYTGSPSVAISAPDSGDFPTTQAAATAQVSGGVVTGVTITNPGAGYLTCSINLLSGNNAANALVTLMPFGLQATSIETYNNSVWTSVGNKMTFSGPSTATVFTTAAGGGSSPVTTSYLKQKIVRLIQANGFLYRLGDSSIDVISNVQTSSTGTTGFNTSNVDAQIGTAWRDSVAPFGRAIIFANPNGVYALYGGAAEKVSDSLDGLFAKASFNTGQAGVIPTAAVATIFGIRVYTLLFTTTDPYTNTLRNIVAIWDGQKWFAATQSAVLSVIALDEINSMLTAWGTDGTHLYKLFTTKSNTLSKVFQTKLVAGSGYHLFKQALRGYAVCQNYTGTTQALVMAIDSESSVGNPVASLPVASTLVFLGAGGVPLTFGTLSFAIASLGIIGFPAMNYGRMLGWTCTTTADDINVLSLAMLERDYSPNG